MKKWDSMREGSSYLVFIHKVIGNSLHFLWTSQQSYKVSSIGPHFSEEELRYEVIFPERNLEGQGLNYRLCTWSRRQESRAVGSRAKATGRVLGLEVG